ncbi:MAG: hypothetical protein GY804_03900 [Alphaproteobacteria bacterium]|nr:hypothetical protein [Alphaproteobacteria bacterium]
MTEFTVSIQIKDPKGKKEPWVRDIPVVSCSTFADVEKAATKFYQKNWPTVYCEIVNIKLNYKVDDKLVTKLGELETNKHYMIFHHKFSTEFRRVKCLGNYDRDDAMETRKVYFTDDDEETPEGLREKFENNCMPNTFVCWEHDILSTYIIRKEV